MTKNKHDHTATKKIKAWLFAIMLLLPFLILIPTGLYYGLNQNAQLSETTITTDNYYQWSDDSLTYTENTIQSNTIYLIEFSPNYIDIDFDLSYLDLYLLYDAEYIELDGGENTQPNITFDSNSNDLYLTCSNYSIYISNFQETEDQIPLIIGLTQQQIDDIENELLDKVTNWTIKGLEMDYLIPNGTNSTTTNTNDISTSIINAWNSTWQNPLFSWTNYSPFYAPMQSFTNVFGINDMQIANVLTYLATITAIYIVFDIIIELFTYLTHLIPRSD